MKETIITFTGETIQYEDATHSYYDMSGTKLLGASSYAKRFGKSFDKASILPRTAQSWGVEEKDLDNLWSINGRISNEFGSSIHSAMELWFRYKKMGEKIAKHKGLEHNYALPKNVHIRDIVLSFAEKFDINGEPEALVSSIKKRMAGRVDLIHIVEPMVCRIADYKTNNEMDSDKMTKYQNQLSFYADILTTHGWTVKGLDIYHHDGTRWTCIPMDVLPVVLSPQGSRAPAWKGVGYYNNNKTSIKI